MIDQDHRYERKYPITGKDPIALIDEINRPPIMFLSPYPSRWVHNIYFDTHDHNAYWDNKNGVKNRQKIRIRWYSDDAIILDKDTVIESGNLEFKIKRGDLGYKRIYPVKDMVLGDLLETGSIYLSGMLPEAVMTDLGSHHPILINHYHRRYYETASTEFRLTADTDLSYSPINNIESQIKDDNLVVEIKYLKEYDEKLSEILDHFSYRRLQFSKYVSGIEHLGVDQLLRL